jgi:hypothetical protein
VPPNGPKKIQKNLQVKRYDLAAEFRSQFTLTPNGFSIEVGFFSTLGPLSWWGHLVSAYVEGGDGVNT